MPDGEESNVTHSMLLIGGYTETDTDTVHFLLQNWWEEKYFIQVTAEYLASTECQIAFVIKGKEVAIQEIFECVDAPFAEGYSPIEAFDPIRDF